MREDQCEVEPAEVHDVLGLKSTPKALLVRTGSNPEDLIWVPKSIIDEDSDVHEPGDTGTLRVPEWWAKKEGLA
ncbi:hypothetical protein HY375_00690 [Candidatus Berkelbacteria bacterium]|nr:hypothetical protein [Candidatus Berkelbacteria bacterium]